MHADKMTDELAVFLACIRSRDRRWALHNWGLVGASLPCRCFSCLPSGGEFTGLVFLQPGKLGCHLGWRLDPMPVQPRGPQRHPQSGEPVFRGRQRVHEAAFPGLRCCPYGDRIGLGIMQPDLSRLQVETPAWLIVLEQNPGTRRRGCQNHTSVIPARM